VTTEFLTTSSARALRRVPYDELSDRSVPSLSSHAFRAFGLAKLAEALGIRD
jgi:hypothetical protein